MADASIAIGSDSDDEPLVNEEEMPIDMVCGTNPKGHDGSSFE